MLLHGFVAHMGTRLELPYLAHCEIGWIEQASKAAESSRIW